MPVRSFIKDFACRAALGLSILLGLAVPAFAQNSGNSDLPEWQVCNETSYVLRAASAHAVTKKITSTGWVKLYPGTCISIDAPRGAARYLYAESSEAHQGGIREWKGRTPICTSDAEFKSDPEKPCDAQDMQSRNYFSVDPAETRTSLVEPEEFGPRAEAAGTQRLLTDLGFKISRIDGRPGRQTNRALAKFLREAKMDGGATTAEKFAALETAALTRQTQIGITVCNDGARKIWTAVAYLDSGEFETRGWWAVEPGQCARPHTASIKEFEPHIFALMAGETEDAPDKILRAETAQLSQFCIAESRFSTIQRENCLDRGYRPASFRALPADKDGVHIKLTDADFAAKTAGGLRR